MTLGFTASVIAWIPFTKLGKPGESFCGIVSVGT